MALQEVIIIILSGIGVFHGLLVAAVLWNYKGALVLSNRLLSVLMLTLSLRIGKSVALSFSQNLEILYVYLGLCLLTVIGPLFLLYSKSTILKSNMIEKAGWLHFLPGGFLILLALPFEAYGFRQIPDSFVAILFFFFYGHLLAYLLVTKFKVINPAGKAASVSREIVKWLDVLFYGLVCLWIVFVLNLFEDRIPYIIGPITYSAVVYTITFLAISRRYLQNINTVKYQTVKASDEEVDVVFRSVETLMQEGRKYLEPDISLANLAKQLKISAQKLSFVINTRAGSNFNEYINKFRVTNAIEILKNPGSKDLTIASIGYDSGFNSLSSFNVAFKKFTGVTPSEYRKVHI